MIKYKNTWKNVGCVDEHYFGNILKILDKDFDLNNNKKQSMFNSWHKENLDINNINNICSNTNSSNDCICKSHEHGTKSSYLFKKISNNTIDEIRNKGYLFLRKVNDKTELDSKYILS